jgi:hypothetical protein
MTSLEEFAKAIEDGDSAKVQQLISTGVVDVNAPLPRCVLRLRSCTPLSNRKEVVDILLRANAHIDSADRNGKTACHAAALRGHADVLAVLLAAGPNLDLFDNDRSTPLRVAISFNHERCALMLIEAGARLDDRWLCDAAALGTDVLQALVDRGVVVSELRGPTRAHCCTLSLGASRIGLCCCRCWCATAVLMWTRVTRRKYTMSHCRLQSVCRSPAMARRCGRRFDVPNGRGETPLHSACTMTIWNVSFYSSQLVQTCTYETQMAGLRFTGLLKGGVGATRCDNSELFCCR